MSFSALADFGYAVRFLRLLTMPVEKTGAFKQGVIDKNYKVIVPAKERTKIQKYRKLQKHGITKGKQRKQIIQMIFLIKIFVFLSGVYTS